MFARSFFNQDTVRIAKQLLGAYLIHESPAGRTVGRIVETEAYLCTDPGSHSFRGMSKRNAAMFGDAGTAYVYLIYGMYHCFNVVTREKGIGEAVLIRALEPVEGVELMKKRRKVLDAEQLCNGPGKLVIAMGIDGKHNTVSLLKGKLRIEGGDGKKHSIVKTTRIGITKGSDLPLRFYIKNNPFVSKK